MSVEKKSNYGFGSALVFMAVVLVLMLLFVPRTDIQRNIQEETDGIAMMYGEDCVSNALGHAGRWYKDTMERTGISKTLDKISLKDYTGTDGEFESLDKATSAVDSYLADRLECLRDMWWWFLLRLATLFSWAPLWIPVFVAALIDGICVKKIKIYSFAYTNPSLLVLFRKIILVSIFIVFEALCLPFALHPVFVPVFFAIIVASLGFVISNLPTRI